MRLVDALERIPGLAVRLRRSRLHDSFPLKLAQGRIYVLPTRAGLAFLAALAVMLVAAINYGLSLGYGLVFLLVGVALSSTFQTFRNLHGLRILAMQVEPVFAGEPAQLRIRIENPSGRRRAGLRAGPGETGQRLSLDAHSTAEAWLDLPTQRRGWQTVGRVTLGSTWPLGLIRAWSILRPDLACLVYPAPEAAPPPLPEGGDTPAGQHDRRAGDDDFAGLRRHRRTDSPRHIAWKVLASGGPLLTKEFASPEGASLRFEWQALPAALDDDARAARLTAWVLDAEARGRRYALRTPQGEQPAAHGPHHLRACLAQLAVARSHDDAR